MRHVSDSLDAQRWEAMARYANSEPSELKSIIVTDSMREAADRWLMDMHDISLSPDIFNDVFRLMLALHPRRVRQASPAQPLSPLARSCRTDLALL